jgi:AcrR family transcriptional regulator
MGRPATKLDDIEKAAMQLFSEKGLAQVTVREIARRADCSEGALYRHYKSKEEMAWRLFSREMGRFGQLLAGVLDGPGSYPERVRQGVETFYRFYDEDPTTFNFILISQHNFPGAKPIPAEINPLDGVTRFVDRGISEKIFGIATAQLGMALVFGLVLQPATLCFYGRLKGPMSQYIDSVSRSCLSALLTREKGGRTK